MSDTTYTSEEEAAIRWSSALTRVSQSELRTLGHQDSRRGKQRAVALLLGHANEGRIRVRELRRVLSHLSLMNEANFSQDMTKDSNDSERGRGAEGLWSIDTYREGRELVGSWHPTERGKKLAADYAKIADKYKEVQQSVQRTFTIRPKAARCPFCRESIDEKVNAAKCSCGSLVHATCLDEFARRACFNCYGSGERTNHRADGTTEAVKCSTCKGTGHQGVETTCVLSRTTARCYGNYRILARPETVEEPKTVPFIPAPVVDIVPVRVTEPSTAEPIGSPVREER